jgi:septal ring factor EnvC (AmiA/AmiB activator)
LRDVASKLSLPLPQDFEERVHHFSSSFFDKNLRHSTLETKDLGLESDLPPLAIELYKSLLSAAQAQNIKKTIKFVDAARGSTEALQSTFLEFDRLISQVHSTNTRVHELQAALDAERAAGSSVHLSGLVSERDGRIAGLEGAVNERDGRIAGLEGAVSERDGQIAGLEGAVSERDGRIAGLEGAVSERDGRIAGLEGAVSELQSESSTLSSDNTSLATSNSLLATEHDALSTDLQERFEELAKLAKLQLSTEDERNALQAKVSELRAERDELATRHQQLATERDALSTDLSQRFHEIALLGKRLLEVEAESYRRVAALQALMDAMQARITWKLGAPARLVWDKARNTAIKIYRLPTAWRIVRLHRSSGLFNHEWYYRQNPDVKATTARPFLHFAFHGVFEGRTPNPSYNESAYLRHTPSAQSNSMKPLLHYTLKGWKGKSS